MAKPPLKLQSPPALLKCLAQTLIGLAPGGGMVNLAIDVGPAIYRDAWNLIQLRGGAPEKLRADLETLAKAEPAEAAAMAENAVMEVEHETGTRLDPVTRQAAVNYLAQIPATVRRSTRRPADPSGQSIPHDAVPTRAEELLPLLPARLPRFKPGDRPIHGLTLDRLLGVGGFAEVWLARDPHIEGMRPVVLKFCTDDLAARTLRNEARLLGRIIKSGHHPGIVQLRRAYLDEGLPHPALEYEYVEGGELTGLIRGRRHSGRGLPPDEAARIIGRLAEIIAPLHSLDPPIVHRDLKPSNILVEPAEGEDFSLKVGDFGIGGVATRETQEEQARGGSFDTILGKTLCGSHSLSYSSPEQIAGAPPDPRDDVFALGVIWCQLLTGDFRATPSDARTACALNLLGLPREHLELLDRCASPVREARPADAAALLKEFLAFPEFAGDLRILASVGAGKIADGASVYEDWAAAMSAEFGEGARTWLPTIWPQSLRRFKEDAAAAKRADAQPNGRQNDHALSGRRSAIPPPQGKGAARDWM